MARMRKIPARKHHGVRDPLKQLEQKQKNMKNITNNPPQKLSDQSSHKFAELKKLIDNVKSGKKIKRIHKGVEDKPKQKMDTIKTKKQNTTSQESKIRDIKQFLGESDQEYLRRVNRITTESLRESKYEAKYGVKVIRNSNTGEITIQKRPKNEIDELLKQKKDTRLLKGKNKKNPVGKTMNPESAKALIKQAIKETNEEKKLERSDVLNEFKRDVIQFGEVVHGPPNLSLPRKASKCDTVSRPGKKDNLLLKTLLPTQNKQCQNTHLKDSNSKRKSTEKNSKSVTKADRQGKRRNLPQSTRTMLESEQSKVIDLYRSLKNQKKLDNIDG